MAATVRLILSLPIEPQTRKDSPETSFKTENVTGGSSQPALGQLAIAKPKPPNRRRLKKRILPDLDEIGGNFTM